jgi:UDP-3-O-[3-hydroxymyristoyl] glucosamine N-acyltransferase
MSKIEFARKMISKYRSNARNRIHRASIDIKSNGIVTFGKNVKILPGCTIGFEGFSVVFDEENNQNITIPNVGKVIIGDNVEIFNGTNICRATLPDKATEIGDNTKIDAHVQVGHNATIGKNCTICAGSIIGGSSVLGDRVFVGLGAIIQPNVVVAKGSFIGDGALVTKDITKENMVWVGIPARCLRPREQNE